MVTGAWVASSIPNPDTCPMAPTDKTNISESQISHLWKAFMMSPYRATERTNEAQVKASPELSTPLSADNQYPFPFPWWQPWVCDELSAFSQGLLSVAPASHGRWQFTLRFLGVGSDFKGLLFSNCPLSLFEFFFPHCTIQHHHDSQFSLILDLHLQQREPQVYTKGFSFWSREQMRLILVNIV